MFHVSAVLVHMRTVFETTYPLATNQRHYDVTGAKNNRNINRKNK